ncbi:ribonuclease Z [bacterium 1xD8-6]|jgi:ribonuclease Z|nr:ribonuclease Z [bacterium D16-36]RKI71231.1 ribonuclease Z [bacterium 1xD8-6]
MLDVCLLGTSGMMPLPGRWLTSLMTRLGGSSLLIDCGEGTQVAVREKGWSVNPIDTICFTHFHGDHISGLPGLLLSMGNSDRKEPVTLIGPKGLEKVVNSLRIIAPGLPFPIQFKELSQKEEDIEVNGYHLRAFRVNHNVVCYGYTITVPRGGKFFLEKAQENQVPMKLWSRLQKGETIEYEGRKYTPDMVIGPPRKGIKLTYCTDTRPVRSLIENARDSDLLICEGMYGEKEKQEKAEEKKHMTFLEAAHIAREAGVEEMWLTHYSPSLLHPEDYMKPVRKIFPQAFPGKDRKSCTLEFPED